MQGVAEAVGGTVSGAGKAVGGAFHGGTQILAGKVQTVMEVRRAMSDIGADVGARIGRSIDTMVDDPERKCEQTLGTHGSLAALDVGKHHDPGSN